jgi:hypothetical protein
LLKVSLGDAKIIVIGCLLSKLESKRDLALELEMLHGLEQEADALAKELLGSASPELVDPSLTNGRNSASSL